MSGHHVYHSTIRMVYVTFVTAILVRSTPERWQRLSSSHHNRRQTELHNNIGNCITRLLPGWCYSASFLCSYDRRHHPDRRKSFVQCDEHHRLFWKGRLRRMTVNNDGRLLTTTGDYQRWRMTTNDDGWRTTTADDYQRRRVTNIQRRLDRDLMALTTAVRFGITRQTTEIWTCQCFRFIIKRPWTGVKRPLRSNGFS